MRWACPLPPCARASGESRAGERALASRVCRMSTSARRESDVQPVARIEEHARPSAEQRRCAGARISARFFCTSRRRDLPDLRRSCRPCVWRRRRSRTCPRAIRGSCSGRSTWRRRARDTPRAPLSSCATCAVREQQGIGLLQQLAVWVGHRALIAPHEVRGRELWPGPAGTSGPQPAVELLFGHRSRDVDLHVERETERRAQRVARRARAAEARIHGVEESDSSTDRSRGPCTACGPASRPRPSRAGCSRRAAAGRARPSGFVRLSVTSMRGVWSNCCPLIRTPMFIAVVHGPSQLLRPATRPACDCRQSFTPGDDDASSDRMPRRRRRVRRGRRREDERAIVRQPVAVDVAADHRRVRQARTARGHT